MNNIEIYSESRRIALLDTAYNIDIYQDLPIIIERFFIDYEEDFKGYIVVDLLIKIFHDLMLNVANFEAAEEVIEKSIDINDYFNKFNSKISSLEYDNFIGAMEYAFKEGLKSYYRAHSLPEVFEYKDLVNLCKSLKETIKLEMIEYHSNIYNYIMKS